MIAFITPIVANTATRMPTDFFSPCFSSRKFSFPLSTISKDRIMENSRKIIVLLPDPSIVGENPIKRWLASPNPRITVCTKSTHLVIHSILGRNQFIHIISLLKIRW